jgi:hypothetical protein
MQSEGLERRPLVKLGKLMFILWGTMHLPLVTAMLEIAQFSQKVVLQISLAGLGLTLGRVKFSTSLNVLQ